MPVGYGMNVTNINFLVSGGCDISGYFLDYVVPDLMGDFQHFHGCTVPCEGDEGAMTATIDYSQCWKWVHLQYSGSGEHQIKREPCGDGICRTWWKYCIEMPEMILHKEFIRSEFISNENCTYSSPLPPLPQHGENYNDYWETDCFLDSPCEED
jgi:hypothetical protein